MDKNIYNPVPVRIRKIIKHTATEWSFLLETKFEFSPGQFVFVSLPHTSEIPITISGHEKFGFEITIRNAGEVTSQFFQLGVGDIIHYRGPYGNRFPLKDFDNEHLIVIAGGSGVAAIKSLVEHYHNGSSQKLKKLDLVVGFKTPGHLLYKKELGDWTKKGNTIVTVDKQTDEKEVWYGGIGFVVDFIKKLEGIDENTKAVVVGPPLMMANSVAELLRYNVSESNIWVSYERHMKCGVGKCGHCRICDTYICLDGPVFNYAQSKGLID